MKKTDKLHSDAPARDAFEAQRKGDVQYITTKKPVGFLMIGYNEAALYEAWDGVEAPKSLVNNSGNDMENCL